MATIRLLQADNFKLIVAGRRKVIGRVAAHPEGGFVATIGEVQVRDKTEIAAFKEAAARHLGHGSFPDLLERNEHVRRINRLRRAEARGRI